VAPPHWSGHFIPNKYKITSRTFPFRPQTCPSPLLPNGPPSTPASSSTAGPATSPGKTSRRISGTSTEMLSSPFCARLTRSYIPPRPPATMPIPLGMKKPRRLGLPQPSRQPPTRFAFWSVTLSSMPAGVPCSTALEEWSSRRVSWSVVGIGKEGWALVW